jgi:hypothetical protein
MSPDAAADGLADKEAAAQVARRRFDALLQRLNADEAKGGFGYEALRRRLILYLRRHEPVEAEALTDEALDRLARRLEEGAAITDSALFAFGIAKLIVLEARARNTRRDAALRDPQFAAATEDEDVVDPVLVTALQECLRHIGRRGADLLFAYYRDDDARRIRTRRSLAMALGISLNTLRNRALRLREALEACVRKRTGTPPQRDENSQMDTISDG